MVFNSLIFLFAFLPISFVIYHLCRRDWLKNIVLVVLSLLFYSWTSFTGLLILCLSIAWNFLTGLELSSRTNEKERKIIFWVAVGVNLLILFVFKYTNFMIGMVGKPPLDILLPVGLSFFTFSEISYLADVYTQKSLASRNLLEYTLYVSFFGKITMGPIVNYHSMQEQLRHRTVSREEVGHGFVLMTKGLVKKVLFADFFSQIFSVLLPNHSVLGVWIAAIAYMMQIYFDFSGYSDMAIGISELFGFHFDANFNHPYNARSVQDFWRRWHISLSLWFRDYLYIPLGGSKGDNRMYIRNICIVWFCTGLWHGANWTFIFWGIYYGVWTLLEKFYLKNFLSKHKHIGHVYTLFIVLIGWVFFSRASIGEAFGAIGNMFGIGATSLADAQAIFQLYTHLPLFFLGSLLCMNICDKIQIIIFNRLKKNGITMLFVLYICLFICCVACIVGSTYQSFLYFAF